MKGGKEGSENGRGYAMPFFFLLTERQDERQRHAPVDRAVVVRDEEELLPVALDGDDVPRGDVRGLEDGHPRLL